MQDANDLNQDGQLDSQDLALLRQLVMENPAMLSHLSAAEKALLDINNDGTLDYGDVMALCRKIANLEMTGGTQVDKLAQLRQKLKHE